MEGGFTYTELRELPLPELQYVFTRVEKVIEARERASKKARRK